MRLSSIVLITAIFAAAGGVSLVSARYSVDLIETASRSAVMRALDGEGMTWADVDTDGLQVYLYGTAPDEAARFAALSVAGRVVDTARLIDQMLVEEAATVAPPRFVLELLRNDSGLSAIGLIPTESDRDALMARLARTAGDAPVSDLLETADHPAPDGWQAAMDYATAALADLPRSKISVSAEHITVKATTDSEAERRALSATLRDDMPEGATLTLDLTAPRPVISPFALRFVIDRSGARFDTCAADTEAARDRILRAAREAGLAGPDVCRLGLGAPSRDWGEAAEAGIETLADLGGGTLTMADTEVVLVAAEGTAQDVFDRNVGELENALPPVFALDATLPPPPVEETEQPVIPEFVATLSPEGAVQLRGRIGSALTRQTATSFAQSHFGAEAVRMSARLDPDLPGDWPVRTLAGIDSLARLANGAVVVTPDRLTVSGRTGQENARAEIAALLAGKLGEGAKFEIDVTYVEALDPIAAIPTPQECETMIGETIGARKITFEPGSATLDASAVGILDALADLLKSCGDIPLEIGGHTDSQGRESMNESLSRDRAQSVLDALRNRFVPVRTYTVTGYGETRPIADNDTEEGREANRRIEFRLIADPQDEANAAAVAPDDTATTNASEDTPTEAADPGDPEAEDAGPDGAETSADGDATPEDDASSEALDAAGNEAENARQADDPPAADTEAGVDDTAEGTDDE